MLTFEAAAVVTAVALGWAGLPIFTQDVASPAAPAEQQLGAEVVAAAGATDSLSLQGFEWIKVPEGLPEGDFAALLTGLHAQGAEVPAGALSIEIQ